jgi:hypothetical protein
MVLEKGSYMCYLVAKDETDGAGERLQWRLCGH